MLVFLGIEYESLTKIIVKNGTQKVTSGSFPDDVLTRVGWALGGSVCEDQKSILT